MDAARRIFARSSVIWSGGIVLALLLGAFVFPLGCGKDRAPAPADALPAGPPRIRVRIVSDAKQVKLTASGLAKSAVVRTSTGQVRRLSFPVNTAVPVTYASDGWHVGGTAMGSGTLTIEPEPDGTLSVEGRPYHGSFYFHPDKDDTIDVVNHLLVDDYLKGVLAAELYPEFNLEAYKAQAIIARTYAIYVARMSSGKVPWDLHSDVRSQMYGGIKSETPKSLQAVDSTAGVVVAAGQPGQERIFKAYYSSCCGGATQSAQDAFGEGASEPFTPKSVGRRCDITAGKYKAKFDWAPIVVSREELARRFKLFSQSTKDEPLKKLVGVRKLEVFKTNAAGRPVMFALEDDRGAKYVLGSEQLRLAVNWDAPENAKLPSAFVTPVVHGSNVRFQDGHGFGHGVGMCQWCIEAEARQGMAHEAIVRDAYPGSVLLKGY